MTRAWSAAVAVLGLVAGCKSEKSEQPSAKLTISGASTLAPLASEMARRIGYVSIGAAEFAAKHGETIKLLPMAGVAATLDNLHKGTFPLARTLHLVTKKGQQNELVRKFIVEAPQNPVTAAYIQGLRG